MPLNRRDFVVSAAGLAAMGVARGSAEVMARPQVEQRIAPPPGPVVIASGNGVAACNRAMELLKQGADPVDAVVAGVNLVEDDPQDHTVGLGGLPNEDGIVELDACVMHGPTHRAGAVAGLRNIRNAASVAKLVMQRTDHVLLIGEGALRFAKAHGFKEEDLLTDQARQMWLQWKETCSDKDNWLPPPGATQPCSPAGRQPPGFTWGTIPCLAVTAGGDLGGCVSTSGRAYKIAGRTGDSAIPGAGLYVDNQVGACGSTGRGEANLVNCSCFLIVELMGRGARPEEACWQVLKQVADRTQPRLRDQQGLPNFQLTFYALRRDGLTGGACLRGGNRMAVHDGSQCRLVDLPGLFPELAQP